MNNIKLQGNKISPLNLMMNTLLILLVVLTKEFWVSAEELRNESSMKQLQSYFEAVLMEGLIKDQIKIEEQRNISKYIEDENLFFKDYFFVKMENLNRQREEYEQSKKELSKKIILNFDFFGIHKMDEPHAQIVPFYRDWREHHEQFILTDLSAYFLKGNVIQKKIPVSTDLTNRMIIALENRTSTLEARILCSEDVTFHYGFQWYNIHKGKEFNFSWLDTHSSKQTQFIEYEKQNTVCSVYFREMPNELLNEQTPWAGVKFFPETQDLAKIGSPHLKSQACFLPQSHLQGSIEQFILQGGEINLSCPLKVAGFETLEDSKQAIDAKIKLLTGKNLPEHIWKNPDPFYKLDFSEAPQFDAILISYLIFRADFSGHLIMQALKYHASRGTLIRIAVSEVISLGKDREMLINFQAEFPHVKLLFYSYKSQNLGLWELLSTIHRTNHIKLFLTYSEKYPQNNQVILGGRNIHDGHVFDQPNSNYVYPTVVDYTPGGDESWAHWEDFEVKLTSKELVSTLMSQFFLTLHADYRTVFTRRFTENIIMPQQVNPQYFNLNPNEIIIRSFVSVPYKDNASLEKLYVDYIDSAKTFLKISTPYFNLTNNILNALLRAIDRKVDIQLITRLDLKGDIADIILSDVNKSAVNKLYKKIKIFEYTTSGKILHSKLNLVDGKMVLLGSVNLNLRSFYHDLENSILIYGPDFYNKVNSVYKSYLKESKLVVQEQRVLYWKKLIINQLGTAL